MKSTNSTSAEKDVLNVGGIELLCEVMKISLQPTEALAATRGKKSCGEKGRTEGVVQSKIDALLTALYLMLEFFFFFLNFCRE